MPVNKRWLTAHLLRSCGAAGPRCERPVAFAGLPPSRLLAATARPFARRPLAPTLAAGGACEITVRPCSLPPHLGACAPIAVWHERDDAIRLRAQAELASTGQSSVQQRGGVAATQRRAACASKSSFSRATVRLPCVADLRCPGMPRSPSSEPNSLSYIHCHSALAQLKGKLGKSSVSRFCTCALTHTAPVSQLAGPGRRLD